MGFIESIFGGQGPKFEAKRVPTADMIVDTLAAVQKVADFNVGPGSEAAGEIARQSNEQSTEDVIAAIDQFFAGQGPQTRENIAEGLEARSRGALSPGTQRLLAGRAAEMGGALGQTAVDNAYTLSLGLTSEQLQSSAAQEYRSLYSTYRQSVPLVSPAQVFEFGGVSTPAALNAALTGVQLQLNRDQFAHNAAVARDQQPSTLENVAGLYLGLAGAGSAQQGGVFGGQGGTLNFGSVLGAAGSLFGGSTVGGFNTGGGGGQSSGASTGSTIGGIAGGVIGAFFGMPQVGAAVGSAAGGLIGGAVA